MSTHFVDEVTQQLQNAMASRGVVREIVLLRTFNSVFEHYATTENDWQSASPFEYRQWREEIKKLLDWLEFILATADSYAQESTQLSTTCQQLQSQLQQSEQRLSKLTEQKTTLETLYAQTQLTAQQLANEVELLQTLAELLPWREKLQTELGEAKYRALSDARLVENTQQKKRQLQQLSQDIQQKLAEQERLLTENLVLQEQEWAALRRSVKQS
jgi:hypothetical protein